MLQSVMCDKDRLYVCGQKATSQALGRAEKKRQLSGSKECNLKIKVLAYYAAITNLPNTQADSTGIIPPWSVAAKKLLPAPKICEYKILNISNPMNRSTAYFSIHQYSIPLLLIFEHSDFTRSATSTYCHFFNQTHQNLQDELHQSSLLIVIVLPSPK